MIDCNKCNLHGISCTGGEICKEACEKNGMYEPMTRADRIRVMTDEELAQFCWRICDSYYRSHQFWLDWLKEESK